jgi:hypothetical protein
MQHMRTALGTVGAVAVLVTAAACGADDGVETKAPAAVDVAGSDQHLNNMAAEAHQADRAATARLAAQAEAYERKAHLDGQARTYGVDLPDVDGPGVHAPGSGQ